MPATGGGAFFSESGKIPTPKTLDPVGQGRKCVSIAGGFPVAAARSGFGMMTAGILTVMVFFLPAPGGKNFCRQGFRPCHTETRLFATLPHSFSFRGQPRHLPDDDPLVCFVIEGAVRGGTRWLHREPWFEDRISPVGAGAFINAETLRDIPVIGNLLPAFGSFAAPPVTACRSGKTKQGLPFRAMPLPFSPRKGTVSRHLRSRKITPTAPRKPAPNFE